MLISRKWTIVARNPLIGPHSIPAPLPKISWNWRNTTTRPLNLAKFNETQVNRAVKRQVLMTLAVHFECFVIKPLESSINSYFLRFRGQQFRWTRPSSSRSTGNFQGKTLPKCSKNFPFGSGDGQVFVGQRSKRTAGRRSRERNGLRRPWTFTCFSNKNRWLSFVVYRPVNLLCSKLSADQTSERYQREPVKVLVMVKCVSGCLRSPPTSQTLSLYMSHDSLSLGIKLERKVKWTSTHPEPAGSWEPFSLSFVALQPKNWQSCTLLHWSLKKSQQNENENFLLAHTGGSKWPAQRAVKVTSRSVISHASSHLETAKKRDKISNVFQGETKETLKLAIGRGKWGTSTSYGRPKLSKMLRFRCENEPKNHRISTPWPAARPVTRLQFDSIRLLLKRKSWKKIHHPCI